MRSFAARANSAAAAAVSPRPIEVGWSTDAGARVE
jgi:hypothetical protein